MTAAAVGELHQLRVPSRAFNAACSVWSDIDLDPALIAGWWQEWESSWTRFSPDSDLSRVNLAAGRFVAVPEHLRVAIAYAIELRDRTGGVFDPTVRVADWGYRQSFEPGLTADARQTDRAWTPGEVEVGPTAVRVAVGTTLDLGGIGKGLVADSTCAALERMGAKAAVVDIGGDVALLGAATINAVDDSDVPWMRWRVSGGGVATSSTLYRRWKAAGSDAHHLIDPRTTAPAITQYPLVTAHATSAALAEVAAKVALITGDLNTAASLGAVCVARTDAGFCNFSQGASRWASPIMVVSK